MLAWELDKTNQFNTTGQRWASAKISSFFDDGGRIYAFHVEDRYTKYGLVGAVVCKKSLFEQFAMSCRVLGLEIETSVMKAIMRSERNLRGATSFSARVVETEANMVCRDVFAKCGFVRDGETFFYDAAQIAAPAEHLMFTMP